MGHVICQQSMSHFFSGILDSIVDFILFVGYDSHDSQLTDSRYVT